jgi:hypothetical protein
LWRFFGHLGPQKKIEFFSPSLHPWTVAPNPTEPALNSMHAVRKKKKKKEKSPTSKVEQIFRTRA